VKKWRRLAQRVCHENHILVSGFRSQPLCARSGQSEAIAAIPGISNLLPILTEKFFSDIKTTDSPYRQCQYTSDVDSFFLFSSRTFPADLHRTSEISLLKLNESARNRLFEFCSLKDYRVNAGFI
jgi:hypothetical protein